MDFIAGHILNARKMLQWSDTQNGGLPNVWALLLSKSTSKYCTYLFTNKHCKKSVKFTLLEVVAKIPSA